jgi:phytoene synthase
MKSHRDMPANLAYPGLFYRQMYGSMTENLLAVQSEWQNYERAYRVTEQVIRKHSKTFFFATALLPTAERRAIRALYGFCRASDDLVDCESTRPEEFEAWREQVSLPASQQTNPLLASWAYVREQYPIDRQYEKDLLDGMHMDLQFRPYRTWEELEVYCYRVASTVGLLSIPIIGLAPGAMFAQAAIPATQLGIALQLTNILRDVGEDAQRGRIYLPEEDLACFDLTTRDIQNQVVDRRFIALMQFENQRATRLYQQALPGISLLAARARPAVRAAALLYARILDEIEALGYQVYTKRAHTTLRQKVSMLPKIIYS